ncbi:MAG: amidophosphoribosyltransferase [Flavobacteriaceae bacterium]
MSDAIKHECGIALLHLKKPLTYYKEKYGTALFGINKMYLMMEKQHNRGQDGAGFASIKFDMEPGERYISRVRSNDPQPIQDIFSQITQRIQQQTKESPQLLEEPEKLKTQVPYVGELMLGHVRYGTFGKNSIESVHPFLRQNNWMHRNLIVAGNFNMTNVQELFQDLVRLGQHPKEMADTITVMENIGHFLDDSVAKVYKKLKHEGYTKAEASPQIAERLKIGKILKRAAKNWDGGYAMAGLLGHGDSFVFRDPSGIRPVFYVDNEEFVAVASERPVLQTAFNLPIDAIQELPPGHAIITKKKGEVAIKSILPEKTPKSCSFERIYFSRGSDADIYQERKKLGALLFPQVYEAIGGDIEKTVFSFIPNTAETSFFGLYESAQKHLNTEIQEALRQQPPAIEKAQSLLKIRPRMEKIAIKDAKLRTFITEDSSRDDLVAHVYDVTYGVIQSDDHLVIMDDSIVRGTTLKKSILKMMDRLGPKQIVVVSSAPQIRYPDCYGIDMARLGDFVAFRAALSLHHQRGTYAEATEEVYQLCLASLEQERDTIENHVKKIYDPFTDEEISAEIGRLLSGNDIQSPVKVIYQKVAGLHQACPNHKGDWYFTGDYPTSGGNQVVNRAFIHFYEGKQGRAY